MIPAPAVKKILYKLAIVSLTVAALALPPSARAAAGAPIPCTVGTTCTVGEFLYDDNYDPITAGATCTLTAKEPDGDSYLSESLISTTDGWYGHSFTAPSTTGYYRADITCTVDGADMSLDKSFEVKSSDGSSLSTDDIASAVWNYSGRTLTNFGDLISNIWASATRTLTGITAGTSSLATKTELDELKETTDENRLLLEQLVNKPIIENNIVEIPDLSKKLEESKATASQLYINTQYIVSKSALLTSRWRSLDSSEIQETLDELTSLIGDESDNLINNSVFGRVNWMKIAWGFDVATQMQTETKSITSSLASIQRSIDQGSSSTVSSTQLKALVTEVKNLERLIGDLSNSSSSPTLFGKVKEVQQLAEALDRRSEDIDKVLAGWKRMGTKDKQIKIVDLRRSVMAVNSLPRVSSLLTAKVDSQASDKELKNKVLAYKGVVATNQILLAVDAGKALANTWVQEGSVVFVTLITNPSRIISQTVPLKYYLPPEVKKEDIIETDEGLTVSYDIEKDQYFVVGEYTLAPGETKTLSVKVNDVWDISEAEIGTLRKQAEELAKPLDRTSYFAQGVTLKSDIDVSLDKVLALKESAVTPEGKIKAHREAQIELAAAKEKIDKLQELVTQAGATGNLFGFVGGAQTLAVWGLIIIIVGGFIWLAVSMRAIRGNEKNQQTPKSKNGKTPIAKSSGGKLNKKGISIALSLILMMVGVGASSSLITKKIILSGQEQVLGETEEQGAVPETVSKEPEIATGGVDIVKVIVPSGSVVRVRLEPSASAEIIDLFGATREVTRIGSQGNWTNIVYDSETTLDALSEGWVSSEFVSEGDEIFGEDNFGEVGTVTVLEGLTGLRVRQSPVDGAIIGKVSGGESFPYFDEQDEWYQIELPDGITGWVSGAYASVNK
jgi:hypothetical protein